MSRWNKAIYMGLVLLFIFYSGNTKASARYYALGDTGKPANYDRTKKIFSKDVYRTASEFKGVVDKLPSSFNWKDRGMVTPAKDQGDCGSCWAFTCVGAFESKILMKGGPSYDLSEQQQISCNFSMYGCDGGDSSALEFWYDEGPAAESCTGYPSNDGRDGDCDTLDSCTQLPFHTQEYYTVDMSNINEAKISLSEDGPTYFRFDVYDDFIDFWEDGSAGEVYKQSYGECLGGHAVLIIGWDDAKNAWLIKNSWGKSGPNGDGTFWISYSSHDNDLDFGMTNIRTNGQAACDQSPEVCDGIDNDCDGAVDEDLTRSCSNTYGQGTETCQNGQWVGCTAPQPEKKITQEAGPIWGQWDAEDICPTVCQDVQGTWNGQWWTTIPNEMSVCECIVYDSPYSSAPEICDGKDNDADGKIDEDLTRPCSTVCGQGMETCQNGQWVGCTAPQPHAEVCDNQDNDCDGLIDEGLTRPCSKGTKTETCTNGQWIGCESNIYYLDADGDGYGNPAKYVQADAPPPGYISDNTDCDDTDKNVHPGAPEIPCNNKDDDCTGGDNCAPLGGGGECTEDNAGTIDIAGIQGSAGGEIRVPIKIQSASGEIKSFGFELTYDPAILEYSGFEQGGLVTSFDMFNVNPFGTGKLRVAGFSAKSSISKEATGDLVFLKFTIKGGQENACYPLLLGNLADHIATFSHSGGCFCIHGCNGDINKDGQITPLDALTVFQCYLGSGSCPECADVNQDGDVTPLDALCVFQKYLGIPSCIN